VAYPRTVASLACAALALAAAGCGGDGDKEELSQESACAVVKQHLKVDAIQKRFGKADKVQDFFGDSVVSYTRDDVDWTFQVGARTGAFRALRQPKGKIEETLPCPQE
jgi:hypothetical protein